MPDGMDAAAGSKVILQEKSAALKISTLSLAWALLLPQPEVDERFLRQVLAQREVGRQARDDLPQHFACLALIN